MRLPENEIAAAPMPVGNGGYSKQLTQAIYPTFSQSAMDFATATIAARCHLTAATARVVVELAQLGGQPT